MCRAISQHTASNREGKSGIQKEKSIGQIFREHGESYIRIYKPPLHHINLIRAIRICKTPQLGGIQYTCKKCNEKHYIYKSCGHSHCMLCQSIKREQWVDRLKNKMLNVPYVHMVFTLPHHFNGLCRNNQMQMYNLVMMSAWETVSTLYKTYHITPGMSTVLHTFGSDMKYHIHAHALVTYGGTNKENEWIYPTTKYGIEKYRKVCATWKSIVLKNIKILYEKNLINYHEDYQTLISNIEKTRWVVHSTRPTAKTDTIENYLAKYINRVGVSDNRVQYLKDHQQVILQYNDYAHQQKNEAAPKAYTTMDPIVFIHQLMQHVLPPYFQKSRNYGLHKLSKKLKDKIPEAIKRNRLTVRTLFEIVSNLLRDEKPKCTKCGNTDFIKEEIFPEHRWILSYIFIPEKERAPPNKKQHTKPPE